MQLIYFDQAARPGWDPVTHMVSLAGNLFSVKPVVLPDTAADMSIASKLVGMRPRRRGGESCLLVCPTPSSLWSVLAIEDWHGRFDRVLAWVIDSFWVEWLPWLVRRGGPVDEFFVTNLEEVEVWKRKTRRPCHWLPWGSDVLGMGSHGHDRPVDLFRVGREPSAWERDEETREACRKAGLTFAGRPPIASDPTENERLLMQHFGSAKFALSFSNRVNPTRATHPTREYVTARWVDALASGASVAGVHPRTETVKELLWPEGLLEIDPVDRDAGVAVLAEAVRRWNPLTAERNHLLALERLDWRWRFERLASALGGSFPVLDSEMVRLRRAIEARRGKAVSSG